MEKVMLSFDNVSAHYGKIQALHNVSLHIKQGEIVTLIGSNGAGKTSTLNGIVNLVRLNQVPDWVERPDLKYRGFRPARPKELAKGDNIIADGRVRDYSYERNGQRYEGEEFIATRIGHDLARTRYEVDRSERTSGRDATAFAAPQQPAPSTATAIGM